MDIGERSRTPRQTALLEIAMELSREAGERTQSGYRNKPPMTDDEMIREAGERLRARGFDDTRARQ